MKKQILICLLVGMVSVGKINAVTQPTAQEVAMRVAPVIAPIAVPVIAAAVVAPVAAPFVMTPVVAGALGTVLVAGLSGMMYAFYGMGCCCYDLVSLVRKKHGVDKHPNEVNPHIPLIVTKGQLHFIDPEPSVLEAMLSNNCLDRPEAYEFCTSTIIENGFLKK